MPLTQLAPPFPIFTDKNGTPLDNGFIFFGEVFDNPETAPIEVYFDPGLTQLAAQPLRTSNGYIMRNGSPAILYAESLFSVTVRDKNNALVVYASAGYGTSPYDIGGPASAEVVIVAGIAGDVTTVAGISGDVAALGPISADVTTVAGISANVTTVAGISADVTTVAGVSADVTAVAAIDTDVTAVAADATDIGTVADDLTGSNTIGTVAGIAGNVTTVAGISADVTAVAGDEADIGIVATDIADVSTVAGVASDVTTVSGISADVTTVAGISADVTTAAANVTDITNFADVYIGPSATDPTLRNDGSALQEGDLYFNTADDVMKVFDGSTFVAAFASLSGALLATNNLSDLGDASVARTNLALGATDSPSFAGLTAATADINGGTIDGTVIGGSTPAAISGTTGSFSGDLTVDTDTLFVDASEGNVGIGTSSPAAPLEVNGVGSPTTRTAIISSSGVVGIHLQSESNFSRNILFQDNNGDQNSRIFALGTLAGEDAQLRLDAGTFFRVDTNGAERLRIDSNGIVDILSGTVELNGNTLSGIQVTIADDAVAVLTFPRRRFGVLNAVEGPDDDAFPDQNVTFIGFVDFGNSPDFDAALQLNDVEVNTTDELTGTTGTAGKLTIGVGGTSGTLYIENRRGGVRTMNITLL